MVKITLNFNLIQDYWIVIWGFERHINIEDDLIIYFFYIERLSDLSSTHIIHIMSIIQAEALWLLHECTMFVRPMEHCVW